MKRIVLAALVFAVGLLGSRPASADLIYLGPTDLLGAGIGNVATLLSFGGQGQTTTPGARVTRNGAADLVEAAANTQINGGSNNQTRTFSELGITNAAQFRLTYNINEPDNLITLTSLQVNFYSPANLLIHGATLHFCGVNGTGADISVAGCTFAEVGGGIGGADHVFGLTAAEANIINGVFNTGIRVGLTGAGQGFLTESGEAGGFDTFFAGKGPGGGDDVTPVPEPTTLLLIGSGLFVAAYRRRQHQ